MFRSIYLRFGINSVKKNISPLIGAQCIAKQIAGANNLKAIQYAKPDFFMIVHEQRVRKPHFFASKNLLDIF